MSSAAVRPSNGNGERDGRALGTAAAPPRRHARTVAAIARLPGRLRLAAIRAYSLYLARARDCYLAPTVDGFELHCSARDFIQRRVLLFGRWEPDLSAVLRALAAPGATVVDIGANVGYTSLLLARQVGEAGRVLAFEASPATFAALERNLAHDAARGGAASVRARNVAVSDAEGELTVYQLPVPGLIAASNSGAATTLAGRGGEAEATVPSAPLHALLDAAEREALTLVKIDVEGAELAIVADLAARLDRFPALESLVLEVADPADPAWGGVLEAFGARGFAAFAIDNDYTYARYLDWREPAPLTPLTPLGAPGDAQTDILLTRRDLTTTALQLRRGAAGDRR